MGYAKVDGLPSFISIWMDKSTVSRYIKENDISMVEKYRIVRHLFMRIFRCTYDVWTGKGNIRGALLPSRWRYRAFRPQDRAFLALNMISSACLLNIQDNILINVDGSPILADFGVSRMLFESHTVTGTKELKGCVRYMAIELLTGPRGVIHCLHTKATDVWGFGMVAYVCGMFR
jgi:hypothetical protein